jgi:hypothetical protein
VSSLKARVDAVKAAQRQRLIEAAKRYAAFDKSDPFTFARCMTHINRDMCTPVVIGPEKGQDGHYDAQVLPTSDGHVQFFNVRRT